MGLPLSRRMIIGGSVSIATIAAALSLATPELRKDEGKVNITYRDLVGVPTNCYGHTGPDVRMGQVKTDAECEILLQKDARAHLEGALRCTPVLANGHPYQLAAVTRFTFNLGAANYCKSTIARRFNANDFRGACEAFIIKVWNKRQNRMVMGWAQAGGLEVRGLVERRKRERADCLKGLPA